MNKLLILLTILFLSNLLSAKESTITIASTTSTHDTGLLESINIEFYNKYKIKVNVLALGTGQALKVAKDGNVELLLVHHTPSELQFMDKGYGKLRYELMYNDFILVGPKNDNNRCKSIEEKFIEIRNNKSKFISRGDDSGTYKKEIELWDLINTNVKKYKDWYFSVGQGMGQTLLIANNINGYTLSDRSTWISFNRKENLKIVCENLPPLFNQYGIMLVNEELNKKLNIEDGLLYMNWIISDEGKKLINNFKKKGEQLFYFNFD